MNSSSLLSSSASLMTSSDLSMNSDVRVTFQLSSWSSLLGFLLDGLAFSLPTPDTSWQPMVREASMQRGWNTFLQPGGGKEVDERWGDMVASHRSMREVTKTLIKIIVINAMMFHYSIRIMIYILIIIIINIKWINIKPFYLNTCSLYWWRSLWMVCHMQCTLPSSAMWTA